MLKAMLTLKGRAGEALNYTDTNTPTKNSRTGKVLGLFFCNYFLVINNTLMSRGTHV